MMSERSAVSMPDQAEKSSVKVPKRFECQRVGRNRRGPRQRFQQIERREQTLSPATRFI